MVQVFRHVLKLFGRVLLVLLLLGGGKFTVLLVQVGPYHLRVCHGLLQPTLPGVIIEVVFAAIVAAKTEGHTYTHTHVTTPP